MKPDKNIKNTKKYWMHMIEPNKTIQELELQQLTKIKILKSIKKIWPIFML